MSVSFHFQPSFPLHFLSPLSLHHSSVPLRFFLEEPAGMQKLYDRDSPPPTKVTYLSDKEQKDWVKDVQGITEQ